MSVVARCWKDGTKVVHMARLRMELFSPVSLTNIRTSEMLIVLAKTAARAIYDELRDESKATFKYLSVSGSEYSWNGCGEARKKALLGKKATNDEAESALGGTASNIQRYGRINISSAGAISDAKRNGFLQREYMPPRKKSSAKAQGIFHGLSEVLREAIVRVAMKDAPSTRKKNNDAIQLQATAQRMKVELLKEKNLECAMEAYIDGLYYYQMYFLPACWKDDRRVVTKLLKKITSDTAKYNALKENIMIRLKEFSWDWCKHPWSKDGRKYTIKELADHLRWIITEEKKHSIPDEPSLNVPQQINLPVLGTQTEEVLELDRKYLANEDAFKKKARKLRNERELKGEGSIYSSMQPFVRPEISDLMNERIDVLSEFKMLGKEESELRWCQEEVVHVYKEQRVPTVHVRWDPIPDCTSWESSTESNQKLLPTRWNKDVVGAWRLDLPIDVEDTSDNESDGKTGEGGSEIEISDGDGNGDGNSECSSTTSSSSSS